MNEMEICPDCKGKKGWWEDPNPYWMDDYDETRKPSEWIKCWTCRGAGKLSQVAYACYRAWGGSAPIQVDDYA